MRLMSHSPALKSSVSPLLTTSPTPPLLLLVTARSAAIIALLTRWSGSGATANVKVACLVALEAAPVQAVANIRAKPGDPSRKATAILLPLTILHTSTRV